MTDKKRTDADWDDLRVFLALARHGSLSATARALRVNHATVARRVASLEATLGRALFERRADGYPLTAAGRAILADAGRMEAAARSVTRGGEAHGVSGVVRISATPSLAEGFLAPRLAGWSARQPGLEIELVGDVAARSLARRAIDVALRLSPPEGVGLVARKAARIGYAIYAAPALRERIAGGEAPRFAGFDEANSRLPEAAWLRRAFPAAALAVRCNTLVGQAAAARSGAVAALLPHFLVAGDASLAPVALQRAPPSRDLWLGTRAEPSAAPAIAAVVRFLFETLARERALFSGR